MPTLKGNNPSLKEIAIWFLSFKRWSVSQGLKLFIIGPLPDPLTDEDAVLKRDALRYLYAAIESMALSGDITDIEEPLRTRFRRNKES